MKPKSLSSLMVVLAICMGTFLLGTSSPVWAQQAAGSITGTVLDPSGSAIPNATVTVRDVDRGTTWTTKTTSDGIYNFPQITVGTVVVSADATGFSKEVRNSFPLAVNQVARIDFKMQVGQVNSTVEVTDAPPLLQTVSTEVGGVLDANTVGNLPMASRDINQLTLLIPGVTSPNIFAFQSSQNTFGTGRPYVNGAREQDDNATLDGMDINQPDNNDAAYVPSPDAIDNFNVITSNAPADYGNYIGGVVVETTKSGTNRFHGTVYEYFRNTDLDANTWQDKANQFLQVENANDTAYVNASLLPRPVLQWNNFGAAVGGPIIKDKLFFFADETTEYNNTPRTANTNSVIPSAFLTGDLSQLCTSQGASFVNGLCSNNTYQLYSPVYLSGPNAGQVVPSGVSRQPFLNNQVPINSKVAQAMVSSPLFAQQFEQQSYYTSGYVHSYQGDLKIDWQASPNDHVMGRYSQAYTVSTTSNGTNVLSPNLTREYPLKNFVANWDHVITPSFSNEVRAGMQIFPANDQIYTNATSQNLPQLFGIPGVQEPILPSMSFGYGAVGNADGVEIFHDTTIEAEDSITWTHGQHSIHAGFELYHYIMNDVYAGNQGAAGSFNFNGQYTGNETDTASNNLNTIGSPFADFLLGLPQDVQQGVPFNFHLRNSLFAGFVQDNWNVTHNLTLNLGVRYELTTARGDKDAANNVNFDLATGTPEVGTNYNTYKGIDNFQPRVGFAWQPGWVPRMVIRGAYDISTYMEGNGVNNMAVVNPPNVELHNEDNISGAALLYPVTTLDQGYTPFSAACTTAELQAFAPACFASGQVHATNPSLQPAVDQQFSLAVQQQFAGNSSMTIAYVGNKDDHMSDIYLYNQKQINSVGAVVPGPYMQPIVNAGAQARYNASDGISRYNALEATFAQKNFHGLDYSANYTWSKCMANSLGYFGSYGDEEGAGESQTQATQNFFQNEYDPKGDYGRCTIDVASAFTAYGVYALPFGRGKLIGSNVSRPVDAIVGGWKIAADTNIHSGFGITPFAGAYMGDDNPSSASTLTGSYEPRPNCVSGISGSQPMQTVQIGGSIGRTNLNPAVVSEVANVSDGGTFGNCETGALRGPSLKWADLNLTKQINFTNQFNIAFSAQFINVTNTPVFSVPASWWGQYSSCGSCNAVRTTGPLGGGAGTVGVFGLLDGSNPGRQIELSLRVNY
ncbi:MAG: carboxypeptidase regulatory-like domain-containing protein [Acidobacteriaceae bacterium]